MRARKPANYPFDGVLRRFGFLDGSLMHAEVRIDDSVFMTSGGATDVESAPAHIHLFVEDAAAATVVQEPARSGRTTIPAVAWGMPLERSGRLRRNRPG